MSSRDILIEFWSDSQEYSMCSSAHREHQLCPMNRDEILWVVGREHLHRKAGSETFMCGVESSVNASVDFYQSSPMIIHF